MVAVMGATITEIGPWYHGLIQPRWAPPEAAYGVAWTAIYAFTALAGGHRLARDRPTGGSANG